MDDPAADEPAAYASPACLLHEVDPAYADPKHDAPALLAALGGLYRAERALHRLAAREIRATDDPARLTRAQRAGRLAARHGDLLVQWISRLGGAAPPDESADPADLAAATALVDCRLTRLLPRLGDPALHGELTKMLELHRAAAPPPLPPG